MSDQWLCESATSFCEVPSESLHLFKLTPSFCEAKAGEQYLKQDRSGIHLMNIKRLWQNKSGTAHAIGRALLQAFAWPAPGALYAIYLIASCARSYWDIALKALRDWAAE
jgi:hypothetical protein